LEEAVLLQDKVAVIYGASGAIGGAVAREFAREGARVFLAARDLEKVDAVAKAIAAEGGRAESAVVDALDEASIERHAAEVADKAGRIDVCMNTVGFDVVQGVPLISLRYEDFIAPITTWTTTQFLTARITARYMVQQGSGVILVQSSSPARIALAQTAGFGVACAAIEGLARTLAAELGPSGVRVVCIRPHRIGDTLGAEADFAMGVDEFRSHIESLTLLNRLPTLKEVAATAAFVASDKAGAMTGAVANLTCGMSID
jgi:3-oxoacyl-[acyl-carrier protein] reductase